MSASPLGCERACAVSACTEDGQEESALSPWLIVGHIRHGGREKTAACVCLAGDGDQAALRAERARMMLAKADGPTTDLEGIHQFSQPRRTRISPCKTISVRAPVPEQGMCFQHALPADPRPASIISVSPSPSLRRPSIRAPCRSPLPTSSHLAVREHPASANQSLGQLARHFKHAQADSSLHGITPSVSMIRSRARANAVLNAPSDA